MPASEDDREHWDQEAHTYDDEYRGMVGERFETEIRSWLARQFTDADNVLELGCGLQPENAGACDTAAGRLPER